MRLRRIAAAFVVALLALLSLALGAAADPGSPAPGFTASVPGLELVLVYDDTPVATRRTGPPAAVVRGVQTADFSVGWNTGGCDPATGPWPLSARVAFSHAVSIWSSLIESSVTIHVDACWRTNLGPTTLGSARPAMLYVNHGSFPYSDTWYGSALADSLAGTDLHSGTAEIVANFNANRSDWYFGTDGNTPVTEVDFLSVALHELCHGLSFYGVMDVKSGLGYNAYSGYPAIFDQFTDDGSGNSLLDDYTDGTAALAAALRGQQGGVYFDGSYASAENGGSPVKLYAPDPWVPGSSYSHVDDIFDGTENALMTWSLGPGESHHHPGPITLAMLRDMGWTVATVDLSMVKRVVSDGVQLQPGGALTIALEIGNSGWITATGVVVTDTLSAGILFPSYDASLTITPTGVVSYVWMVPDLGPGAAQVITIYGTFSPSLPAQTGFFNTATISTDRAEEDRSNNSSTVLIGGSEVRLPLTLRSY
jgi:uncharacterized repeat protein (TIGR01451 family)